MLSALLFLFACEPDPPPTKKVAPEPEIHEESVFRLELDHAGGSFNAGSGFVAQVPESSRILGVTVHHLFSQAGGLERELFAAEVERFVLGVHPIGMNNKALPDAGPMLYVQGARVTRNRQDWTSDLAVFKMPGHYKDAALTLAKRNASVGETLWLVQVPHDREDVRLQKVIVQTSNANLLLFRFIDPRVNPAGASGAPLVNRKGEVVGMNTAEGNDGKNWWGTAHPVESISIKLKAVDDG